MSIKETVYFRLDELGQVPFAVRIQNLFAVTTESSENQRAGVNILAVLWKSAEILRLNNFAFKHQNYVRSAGLEVSIFRKRNFIPLLSEYIC